MSESPYIGDHNEVLLRLGLPAAGNRLIGEVQTILAPAMADVNVNNTGVFLDIVGRTFAEEALGEEVMENLPAVLPEEFLLAMIAAAFKKFGPSQREERARACITSARQTLEQRLQFRQSMTRASPPPVNPMAPLHTYVSSMTPQSTVVVPLQTPVGSQESVVIIPRPVETIGIPPATVASAATDQRDLIQLMTTSIERAIEANEVRKKERKKATHKRCEQCGKAQKNCLCASLLAQPLPHRGEFLGDGGAGTVPHHPPVVQHTLQQQMLQQHQMGARAAPKGSKAGKSNKSSSSDDSDASTSSFSSQGTPTKSQADQSFRNPSVLFLPEQWNAAFNAGQTLEDFRRELLLQFGIQRLRRDQPHAWTTDLGEQIVEIVALCTIEGSSTEVLSMLVAILFRLRLFAQGAPSEEIDKAMSKLRGYKLPKVFRAASAGIKKATTKAPYVHPPASTTVTGRLPPAVWKAMSPAAQAAHKKKYPRA